MDEDTPTFCKIIGKDHNNQSFFSFSKDYNNNTIHSKHPSRHSTISKSKMKHKKSKTKTKRRTKTKFLSLDEPNEKTNFQSYKMNINNYNILKIQDFLNKNKFKLNNNFDRKNSKKFLNSKEIAFQKPLCELDDIIE